MQKAVSKKTKSTKSKEPQSLEDKLWEAAEELRGPVEFSDYKYIVLGLIFLKFLSDNFEEKRKFLETATQDPKNKEYYCKNEEERNFILENKAEYHKDNVYYVRKSSLWSKLMKSAAQENLGIKIDQIMNEIETDNKILQGVLPKVYSATSLSNKKLGLSIYY